MKTENESVGEGRKIFVACALCDNKKEAKKYADEVLDHGWFEVFVMDKDINIFVGGYICEKCFEKYFMR